MFSLFPLLFDIVPENFVFEGLQVIPRLGLRNFQVDGALGLEGRGSGLQ